MLREPCESQCMRTGITFEVTAADRTRLEAIAADRNSPQKHEVTHWTASAMAKASGISASSVQRVWRSHGLAPHRFRQFKLSKDPNFVEKPEDIVGFYMAPPAHAIVLSIDEKSQIQALDRTQPGLPMKNGRCGTMTHDYKRHGTTTLFAALNVIDGTVTGQNMQRHRHQEFIRFLNAIEAKVPAGKIIHAVIDNYATHKHPKVLAWLALALLVATASAVLPLQRAASPRRTSLPPGS